MRGRIASTLFCVIFKLFRRCIHISSKELAINEGIKFKEVRVISDDGSQIGIIPVAKKTISQINDLADNGIVDNIGSYIVSNMTP